jgi:hypothetical protein
MSIQSYPPNPVWVTGGCLIGPASSDSLVAPIHAIDPTSVLGVERVRRLDPLSQYALVAVELACQNAGIVRQPGPKYSPREGVIVGTALGATVTSVRYAKRLVKSGPALTNPIDFPDSIDGAPAAHIALDRGLCGPSITFCDGESSTVSALVYAARLIESGRVDRMIVVAGDYLDDLFVKALAQQAASTGRRYGQAVLALVLERDGFFSRTDHATQIFGFSPKYHSPQYQRTPRSEYPGETVEPPVPRLMSLSGVLSVASAWWQATRRNAPRLGSWQPDGCENVWIDATKRAWFIDAPSPPYLSFLEFAPQISDTSSCQSYY